ncbi:MAG TPA: cyclopropane-fatty-acyl-phospholipid synthase family protein [Steroidobacteraceae bacterium]|nr:cyclopropane-fatty-acyl-phospholipid synthase family protein [Steroidobacteraceae bacterium]
MRDLAPTQSKTHAARSGAIVTGAQVVRKAATPYRGSDIAAELLQRLFHRLPLRFAIRLWDETVIEAGSGDGPRADFELAFRNPEAVCSTILGRDPLRLAESYFRGDMDIEGDLFAALALKDHLEALQLSLGEQLGAVTAALRLRAWNADRRAPRAGEAPAYGNSVRAHSKLENREAIHFHYDVSNDFYALWLDRAMVYSCAYFEDAAVDLDHAQAAKLDHICRKLALEPGERFLDVGCGWGALVIHAAREYGVIAHGITLSAQQLELAQQRIAEAGLQDRVHVELRDYRDLEGEGSYDKVASVGMVEHVGLKNLPVYFATVHRLLKPHGLFLNHGITHDAEGWKKTMSTEFINRYVFPDGELDSIGSIQRVIEKARFEIADVEALRPHYAMTLRHWVARLESHHAEALSFVNEATYRVWRLYMAACALDFERGEIGIYQVLVAKRAPGRLPLPLTRRYMYDHPAR